MKIMRENSWSLTSIFSFYLNIIVRWIRIFISVLLSVQVINNLEMWGDAEMGNEELWMRRECLQILMDLDDQITHLGCTIAVIKPSQMLRFKIRRNTEALLLLRKFGTLFEAVEILKEAKIYSRNCSWTKHFDGGSVRLELQWILWTLQFASIATATLVIVARTICLFDLQILQQCETIISLLL